MATATQASDIRKVSMSPGRVAMRRALKHGSFWVGGLVILAIAIAAILAPLLTQHDPSLQNLAQRFVPPIWAKNGTWEHILGTDNLGRDYLARILYGARISLIIGIFTVLISGAIGTALGIAAGYWGGWADLIINFVLTIWLTLPVVLVALVVVALVGSSLWLMVIGRHAPQLRL